MKEKYQNKYRISSTRLKNWDYGWNAAYFVTICTHKRKHYFGDIKNRKMQLSKIGEIAQKYWEEIPKQFNYAKLDTFVIMPDHMHGIIMIAKDTGAINRASTMEMKSSIPGGITGNKNPMLYYNLSRIIRWYKGRVTYEARKIQPNFTWQPRFYDHIVRDERSFQNISEYILNNPLNWRNDQSYHS
jgi:putative transposase